MPAIVLGIIAILVGLFFCFRGYGAMRLVIAIWGGFVGFLLGAGLVASVTGTPTLAGPGGWIAGLVGAVLVGSLSYAFYAFAVLVTMGSVGYGLGAAAAGFFAGPPWVATVAGVAGAVVLVLIALATHLPALLLILVSASGGSSAVVGGVALLLGQVSLSGPVGGVLDALTHQWYLGAASVVLFVAGVVVQLRRRSGNASLRSEYR